MSDSVTKRAATTRTIAVPSEKVLVEVTAFPDEVMVEIHTPDKILSLEHARELAQRIIEAADEAETIDWDEDTENPSIIPRAK